MSSIEHYTASLSDEAPPPDADLALQALWWAGKRDWDRAHGCVQQCEGTKRCDWVHAHLHRVEGDMENAGYWYSRAGQPVSTVSIEDEWAGIAAALIRETERNPSTPATETRP